MFEQSATHRFPPDPGIEEIILRDRHDLDMGITPDRFIGSPAHRTLEDFHEVPPEERDTIRRGMPPQEPVAPPAREEPRRPSGPWRKAR